MYVLELGGENDAFAAREAATAASDVEIIAPGLATASEVTDRVRTLAYTHRAAELVGTCESAVDAAVALLRDGRQEFASVDLGDPGSVRVRAVDVRGESGVNTQAAERALGQVLVDRGFGVDLEAPDHELRALFSANTCALGWLAAESVRDFGDRQPTERPFFQPGSMGPLLARALANLAGARPGAVVLDPMCGTGGILIEAGLVGARAVGVDVQGRMVRGSRENLVHFLNGAKASVSGSTEQTALPETVPWGLARGDARSVPIRDGAVDGVVFDVPYGRQSKITGDLDALVEGALRESARVAERCVVVGDRPWARIAHDAGWTSEAAFHRRVHRSLTRHVLVLDR
ncbi:MAG: TIGR01177 family methyltransferase [Haloarculaceae archaeon]